MHFSPFPLSPILLHGSQEMNFLSVNVVDKRFQTISTILLLFPPSLSFSIIVKIYSKGTLIFLNRQLMGDHVYCCLIGLTVCDSMNGEASEKRGDS